MTIVASWGGGTSNCYTDWTSANSFVRSALVDIDAWTSADPRKQEAALLQATIDVDGRQYVGSRYYSTQTLEFPRQFLSYWPGNGVADITTSNVVQSRCQSDVQRATCYQALWILRNNGRNIHAENMAAGIKQYYNEAGPIKEQYKYTGSGASKTLCQDAMELLSPWMTGKRILRG